MSKHRILPEHEMLPEYDFSGGTRGKHALQYRRGHTVKIKKINGSTEVQHYKATHGKVAHAAGTRRTNGRKKLVKDKYRGTTIYAHVLAELVRAAQYRGLTTYQDIAVIMGLPTTGSKLGKEAGHCVGEISEDEVLAGRPMLSALVVKSTRGKPSKPGPGFYNFARQLGRMEPKEDEDKFWERERDAVYTAWRRPIPK